jgi:hypothetical protein
MATWASIVKPKTSPAPVTMPDHLRKPIPWWEYEDRFGKSSGFDSSRKFDTEYGPMSYNETYIPIQGPMPFNVAGPRMWNAIDDKWQAIRRQRHPAHTYKY